VRVVLPASGWLIIANVRRRAISCANSMLFVSLTEVSSPVLSNKAGKYENIENIGHGRIARRWIASGCDQRRPMSGDDVHISSKFGIFISVIIGFFFMLELLGDEFIVNNY